VVFVAGARGAAARGAAPPRRSESTAILLTSTSPVRRRVILSVIILAVLAMIGFVVYRAGSVPQLERLTSVIPLRPSLQTVRSDQSINAAVLRARAGSEIVVEPGEYRERVTLTGGVRLISRVPRGATIRLPATASDAQPAVIATGTGGSMIGFRIVGDAQTPLGVGIKVEGSGLSLIDLEVSGAAAAAVWFASHSSADLIGSDIHDNPGQALNILAGATPRITHSVFSRNGTSQNTPAAFSVEKGAVPVLQRNTFLGVGADAFAMLDDQARLTLEHENWFVTHGSRRP
jgi:hypothetical protein